ncbi:MAG: 50S ribosomal protein L21 [Candidatus Pacebacteria bacterium]|nr:50S ribosomal protein L21 [Candidatus Paceibacterota bacterium]
MLAVIKTGGKQYLVKVGDKIQIEKIKEDVGKEVVFDKVLLVEKQKKVQIGTPFVEGAKVIGKVLEHKKGKKITVFKYKPKKRYRKKQGHRQLYTVVEIKKIEA